MTGTQLVGLEDARRVRRPLCCFRYGYACVPATQRNDLPQLSYALVQKIKVTQVGRDGYTDRRSGLAVLWNISAVFAAMVPA